MIDKVLREVTNYTNQSYINLPEPDCVIKRPVFREKIEEENRPEEADGTLDIMCRGPATDREADELISRLDDTEGRRMY